MSNKDKSKKDIIITIAVVLFLLLAFLITKTIINNNKEKINNEIDIQVVVSDKTNEDNNNESSTLDKELVVELEEDESFLITFALNDGTILQSTFVKKGELPVYLGAVPVIEGYKFIGWNKTIKKVSESTTYYARFEKVEEEIPPKPTVYYTITVKANDNGTVSMAGENGTEITKRFASGSYCTITAIPNTGATCYSFEKWDDEDLSNPRTIRVTGNTTYVASFVEGFGVKYKDYLEGIKKIYVPKTATLTVDTKGDLPQNENPIKTIDNINNESVSKDISEESLSTSNYTYLGFSYSSSTKTLSAKYQKKVQINTDTILNSITNEVDYGKAYNILSSDTPDYYTDKQNERKYDKESKVLLYALPTKDDCDFVGWKLNGKIVSTQNPLEITATSDSTYTAVYEDDYNYLYFENTSNNNGTVSMHINGFDYDVYHVRDLKEGENINEFKHPENDDKHVYINDDGKDILAGDSSCGYKHIKLDVPDLFLEYRLDKYVSPDNYNIGFWEDFNNENPKTADDYEDNCYEKILIEPGDRILFRAKKVNGKYNTRSISAFKDNRLHGLTGETYYIYDDPEDLNGDGDLKRSDPSVCLASHLFELNEINEDKDSSNDPKFSAGGSITSILDGKGSSKNTDITKINGGSIEKHYFTYAALFAGTSFLTDISDLTLTSTNTTIGCYYALFQGAGIKYIPVNFLPAKTLTSSCYAYMFADSKLESLKGPNDSDTYDDFILPATKIAGRCYFSMFQNCKQLVSVPDNLVSECHSLMNYSEYEEVTKKLFDDFSQENIQAYYDYLMTQSKCYYSMFKNCTNLKNMPALPATGLQPYCYEYMFYNCTSLESEVFLPAEYLYDYCYSHMFDCADGNNSKISKIYLGANEWGISERTIYDDDNPYRDFELSLNPFTSFLGHTHILKKEDQTEVTITDGVSKEGECIVYLQHFDTLNEIKPDNFFVGDFKNNWKIQKWEIEDSLIQLKDIINFDSVNDELNEELNNINNIEIIDDNSEELANENPDEIIETDYDKNELNEDEINDDALPIEHKDNDINPLDELEA